MCIHMSVTSLIILPQNRIKKIKNAYTGANDIIAGSKCPRNNPNSILVPGPPAVNQIRIRGLQNHYCNICSMANIAALRKCNGIMSTSDFGSSRQKNLLTPLAAWPSNLCPSMVHPLNSKVQHIIKVHTGRPTALTGEATNNCHARRLVTTHNIAGQAMTGPEALRPNRETACDR